MQCFYLACLIAHAVRGRANLMHIIVRVPLLKRLEGQLKQWQGSSGGGSQRWCVWESRLGAA